MKELYSRNNIAETRITKTGILLIFLLSLFLIPNTTYSQEHQCDAQLEFVNDRPNKTAGISGVTYRMKLINNGDSGTFLISVDNIKPTKESALSKNKNLDLNNVILDLSLKEQSEFFPKDKNSKGAGKFYEVFLNENDEYIFYVKQHIPNGTKIGSRNSTRVEVVSNNCPDLNIYKIVYTEFTGLE